VLATGSWLTEHAGGAGTGMRYGPAGDDQIRSRSKNEFPGMTSETSRLDKIPGPPPRGGLWRESFGLLEPIRLALRLPGLSARKVESGLPVMVLPGFGMTDRSTWLLRHYLSYIGHTVEGWDMGRNHGRVPELIPMVLDRVSAMASRYDGPVALVGWSLGGYLAREAARERPAEVIRVITLGSPVVGGPKYTVTHAHYVRKGYDLDEIEAQVAARDRVPIRVPVTAIYSRRDAIVAWQACIDKSNAVTEHVEVAATHLGLGLSPDVLAIVADSLAGKSLTRRTCSDVV
jgi:pimeloyl-ACP methyl ester carboxylesterase